jgi:hypothetical protein
MAPRSGVAAGAGASSSSSKYRSKRLSNAAHFANAVFENDIRPLGKYIFPVLVSVGGLIYFEFFC